MDLLLKHCDILTTENGSFRWIQKGYLGISQGKIDYIGQDKPQTPYAQEKNMQNRLLLPGLINCHSHSAMTLLRGMGSDLPLQDWLFGTIIPVEDQMRPEDIHAGMSLAMLEMIATGTTSFTDMYMEGHTLAQLVAESGMKVNIARVMQGFDPSESYQANGRGAEALALYNACNAMADDRVRVDFSIHAEYTCQPHLVEAYSAQAKELGVQMHIHLAETKAEQEACIAKYGKTPTQWFYDLGTFQSPTLAAHCVWLTPQDMEILAENHVSVVHNPTSILKLGSGIAPIPTLLNKGINVALGTDGAASNNNLNMLEELHLAALLHKGHHLDPTVLPASQVLTIATANGAKAQGRNNTGALVVGKQADIVALDLQKPHLFPNLDPLALVCYSAQGSDVAMTMVDGNILYENGIYLTMDVEKVLYEANKALTYLHTTTQSAL